MDKPPNSLVPLLLVLMWWRTSTHCAVVDISRAYQTVKTGPRETYSRLPLWKEREESQWRVKRYNSMTYGDLAAAAGLELAKGVAARKGLAIDEETASQIASKLYVDDGAVGAASRTKLEEMRGSRSLEGTYDGLIAQVLATAGMKPKFVAIPGSATPEEIELLGGKVLGVEYDIQKDIINFTLQTSARVLAQGSKKKKVSVR